MTTSRRSRRDDDAHGARRGAEGDSVAEPATSGAVVVGGRRGRRDRATTSAPARITPRSWRSRWPATQAKGGTLYVTLEPCNHHGRTPPCADAIVKAGIARVVIGCRDPEPARARRRRAEALRESGVDVEVGVAAAGGARAHRAVDEVHHHRPALRLAEARALARRPHRDAHRRLEVGHRPRGAREGAGASRARTTRSPSASAPRSPTIRGSPCATSALLHGRTPSRVVFDTRLRLPLAQPPRADRARSADLGAHRSRRARRPPSRRSSTRAAASCASRTRPRVASTSAPRSACSRRRASCRSSSRAAPSSPEASSPRASPTSSTPSSRPSCSARAAAPARSTGPAPTPPPRRRASSTPKWELCGRDAYVSGPLVVPVELTDARRRGYDSETLRASPWPSAPSSTTPTSASAKKAAPIEDVTPAIERLIDDMAETMYAAPGVGLAATQIGEALRLFIVDVAERRRAERSPGLHQPGDPRDRRRDPWPEGCLSFPGVNEDIERAAKVSVRAHRPRRQGVRARGRGPARRRHPARERSPPGRADDRPHGPAEEAHRPSQDAEARRGLRSAKRTSPRD